ncbi:chemotaxis regulatory protein ChePep-like [Macrobrachium rosenbergii]|uniref:chemotaxis regulatory protein ChePep-like n=1 Tax=Macrobrachium rosenbergii TaxID=79674 RepID=UPI0034D68938
MSDAPEDRAVQVINRTFPTSREEGGTTDLLIHFRGDRHRDLKLLLQSLTLPPLRKITFLTSAFEMPDDVEDLKTLCRERGIQVLCLGPRTFSVMENNDSEKEEEKEEEETDDEEEKKRKREEEEEEEDEREKKRRRREEGEEGSTSREREVTQ